MVAPTMTGDHNGHISDYTAIVMATGQTNAEILFDKSATLVAGHEHPIVTRTVFSETSDCLCAPYGTKWNGNGAAFNGSLYARNAGKVRRLTPLECERLQGFPDGWTDIGEYKTSGGRIKKTKDTARYKALGNSIALPSWMWVLYRLCQQYDKKPTMASLFDGIGGFPLLWQYINGPGYCLWASEIEDFPMAVTAVRFPEDEELHED